MKSDSSAKRKTPSSPINPPKRARGSNPPPVSSLFLRPTSKTSKEGSAGLIPSKVTTKKKKQQNEGVKKKLNDGDVIDVDSVVIKKTTKGTKTAPIIVPDMFLSKEQRAIVKESQVVEAFRSRLAHSKSTEVALNASAQANHPFFSAPKRTSAAFVAADATEQLVGVEPPIMASHPPVNASLAPYSHPSLVTSSKPYLSTTTTTTTSNSSTTVMNEGNASRAPPPLSPSLLAQAQITSASSSTSPVRPSGTPNMSSLYSPGVLERLPSSARSPILPDRSSSHLPVKRLTTSSSQSSPSSQLRTPPKSLSSFITVISSSKSTSSKADTTLPLPSASASPPLSTSQPSSSTAAHRHAPSPTTPGASDSVMQQVLSNPLTLRVMAQIMEDGASEEIDVVTVVNNMFGMVVAQRLKCPPESNAGWCDFLAPSDMKSIVGDNAAISRFSDWLSQWKDTYGKSPRRKARNPWTVAAEEEEDLAATVHRAVMLVGPPGSAKTSTVYAMATQLGFRILELNASSKRSGKKIIDDFQEATQSHQVGRSASAAAAAAAKVNAAPSQGKNIVAALFGGPQGSSSKVLKRGYKAKVKAQKEAAAAAAAAADESVLMLFEQVDCLFPDEAGVPNAVKQLMNATKRPIVLVSDSVVPEFANLPGMALIHFSSPPLEVTTIWLRVVVWVCAGVLISQDCAQSILDLHSRDLRRTLHSLQLVFSSRSSLRPLNLSPQVAKLRSEWMTVTQGVAEVPASESQDIEVDIETTTPETPLVELPTMDVMTVLLGLHSRLNSLESTRDMSMALNALYAPHTDYLGVTDPLAFAWASFNLPLEQPPNPNAARLSATALAVSQHLTSTVLPAVEATRSSYVMKQDWRAWFQEIHAANNKANDNDGADSDEEEVKPPRRKSKAKRKAVIVDDSQPSQLSGDEDFQSDSLPVSMSISQESDETGDSLELPDPFPRLVDASWWAQISGTAEQALTGGLIDTEDVDAPVDLESTWMALDAFSAADLLAGPSRILATGTIGGLTEAEASADVTADSANDPTMFGDPVRQVGVDVAALAVPSPLYSLEEVGMFLMPNPPAPRLASLSAEHEQVDAMKKLVGPWRACGMEFIPTARRWVASELGPWAGKIASMEEIRRNSGVSRRFSHYWHRSVLPASGCQALAKSWEFS